MRKGVKVTIITAVSIVLVAAILIGVFWFLGRNSDPVEVLSVAQLKVDYYQDGIESYGRVTTDKLQSIYASGTQEITEVFVTEGQSVKKGDPLLSYDTTLSDIQLERKEIEVKQAELNLQRAKEELRTINAMKPYVAPATTAPTTQAPQPPLEPITELPYLMGGNGTQDNPYRWLCEQDMVFDNAFLEVLMPGNTELWIAFEVREENALKGELINRWGMKLTRGDDGELRFSMFVPEDAPEDETNTQGNDTDDSGWVDDSSGYTSAEIAKMRAEKEKEIRNYDLTLRMVQVEYERMKTEVENGIVYAAIDGSVITIRDAQSAAAESMPVMVVSGGGSYYIDASISEFNLEEFPIGTQVRIMSWENGQEAYGVIAEVSDVPADDNYYYGSGNPNASYYTATISVDASVALQENSYVGVYFGEGAAGGLYLDNMYLRTEGSKTYVYCRGEDGTLEKRYVQTGEIIWSSYTRIISGLTDADYIAFPYGKNVKEGADTVEGEIDYGYYGGYAVY